MNAFTFFLKKFFHYCALFLPLIIIGSGLFFFIFQTTIPQIIYMDSLRNLTFDCLRIVDASYVYKGKEGICHLKNVEYDTVITHDKEGFRNINSLDEKKLVVLGDSHAYGIGVSDSETFAWILGEKYNIDSKNLAMGSYATKRELDVYRVYSSREKFVVIAYCSNDAGENAASLSKKPKEFELQIRDNLNKLFINYEVTKRKGIFAPVEALTNSLKSKSFQLNHNFYGNFDSRNINAEANTFAQIISGYRDVLGNKKIIIFESSAWGMNHPQFQYEFDLAIKKWAPWAEYIVLDSSSFLSRSDYYFLDDHLNSIGHQKVANEIFKASLTFH